MGAGATKGPTAVGVPANPRVQYSRALEKQEKKKMLVDAPVLVDVEHGSVRYRQPGADGPTGKKMKKKEQPYENEKGKELSNKEHYFYHTRLNDYGPESSKEQEDAFKFYYVMRGPNAARQKKIYYVYGQGWGATDGLKVKPTDTVGKGKDYAWSSTRMPNSLYYALGFDETVESQITDEDKLLGDLESCPNKFKIRLNISLEENVASIKARLAIRLLKATRDIHIAFDNKEMRDEDVPSDLWPKTEEEGCKVPESICIILTLITE